jgi:SulP family sulfate permease
MFRPKLFDTLQKYSITQFTRDGLSGLVVGIVALPLAIAFAIASGATPDKGIYTAVIAGFIISVLGGSRVQIGGPTGAFVIIVYGIIHQYGYPGLLLATIIAGIILVIFGIAKLGSVIKFIPHSVITGFTLGIALLIFTGQFSDFFGLGLQNLPADFIDKMGVMARHAEQANPYAIFAAVATIGIILVTGKVSPRLPGSLIALVAVAFPVYYFNIPVETIGSRFGAIPHHLPSPSFPVVDLKTIKHLLSPAFSIAMLGAIESLLSAVVADGMIGSKHRSNTELVAQGVANIVTPLFGGLPATGAIARTATNIKNGGRTPVAGIVHAIVLLAIMLFFGALVGYIPLACLAGILMVVAYHMSEWRSALSIMRISRGSALVMMVTFALTVFVDLTAAIEIGLIVSMFVFVRNMAQQTSVSYTLPLLDEEERAEEGESDYASVQSFQVALPKGAVLYEINGPLFFGAVYKFREAMAEISRPPKVLILQLQQVPVIDSTGVRALQEAFKALRKKGTRFILCGMQPGVRERLERAGIQEFVDTENSCEGLPEAVARAQALLRA